MTIHIEYRTFKCTACSLECKLDRKITSSYEKPIQCPNNKAYVNWKGILNEQELLWLVQDLPREDISRILKNFRAKEEQNK